MFRGLINDAKSAAAAVIGKYLARASVAVPFIIAFGFGTAAVSLLLVERFGAVVGYALMAGGFTLIGLLATLIVGVKEHEEQVAEKEAEREDTAQVASDTAVQAAMQAPLALLGALFSTPAGPSALAGGARMIVRNMPLVVLLALLALLFWPSETTEEESQEVPVGKPNGLHSSASNGLHREAA
jgi:hypothetical protein